ncbi:amino acid ABC transporter ATP-binding protein [Campylobacter sp. RM13119]|uniref:Amino acid ABC transporter ATP-binding protein n=1 Tax=Campylobacter californiensis TaxID=1032243 RepID=A0ABD4JKG2_9BACT|nr:MULTISPECIES: amino acid ABC transporter ATP-binding protein [unclassified Campylobacter]MBE2985291.1 amino acid ABC transporter ATP-binding protein [Campylobacter sp. RM6883]MBE2987129.1 amino acid ABC transporter ATP-binding protein [Campylobacter sp. RM12919]MBE2988807.1 amino acid ABC transporter ATP-binding protein [Campylobacter sp. RM12920]MBE2995932.1 amino acid ABC transporter ATP-binding protein [Campylobacter sp. RM6913]MBE3606988.1 amino acid ABC transporter ATP-binding protein 
MIKFTNLIKKFGENVVLKGINLEIYDNQTTVILGSSGSGKSTLLRCINLLEIPNSGELCLGDFSINFSAPHKPSQYQPFRSHTGMVFQSFNLFPHLTVLENVIEGPTQVLKIPRDKAVKTAYELLDKVGLKDKAEAYPNRLSGGQSQRVAIARALAMQPAFLLLDEPTSALDPELEAQVLKTIGELSKEGRSLIIVTHNMNFARKIADRILFLDHGLVAFDGVADEFFNSTDERIAKFISAMDF